MIAVETDPADVGIDAARLARLDRHFGRYVDDGRLAGWLVIVTRRGQVAHVTSCGDARPDALWRIYSMTKPITSVAAMMLWEEGAFELTDPVARFLPAFGDVEVWEAGRPREPVRMWHLLTHTSGLTYGFHHAHPVDAAYREAGFEWATPPGMDLAACCDAWAGLPLLFEPGTEWNYGVSTDVLGRVLEVLEGRPLDEVLRARVLDPLGMSDTAFWTEDASRLAAMHVADPATKRAVRDDRLGAAALRAPDCLLGGGGLVSSATDYHRFTQMLLRRGDGLLAPRTVDYMALNHLPGGHDLEQVGRPLFAETRFDGVGFGLGFSVVVDPAAYRTACSRGEIAWGGAASTAFWVDPAEELTVMFFTQLLPSSTHPIRTQLRQLVYQGLTESTYTSAWS